MHESRISANGPTLTSWNPGNTGSVTRRHSLSIESVVAIDHYQEMYRMKACRHLLLSGLRTWEHVLPGLKVALF